MNRLLPFLLVLFFALPAAAEDGVVQEPKKMETTTYAPDYCEFSATFPAQAYKSRRCEDKEQKSCYDLVSFTKVFDMVATVKVDIICNPSTQKMYDQLTTEAMETTVRAMTKGSVIEAYDVSSRQESTFRHAGLLGKGREGMHDTIYIAQLWSGQKSMMSVEAQLIGDPIEEADQMFADILRSIGPVPVAEEDINTEEKEEETPVQPKKGSGIKHEQGR